MPGRSILPILQGGRKSWENEIFFQVSESEVGRGIRTPRWKYGTRAPNADAWEDMDALVYEEAYLYDLKYDPYELDNLIGQESHVRVTRHLRQRLLQRLELAGERLPQIRAAPNKPRFEQRQVLEGEEFE